MTALLIFGACAVASLDNSDGGTHAVKRCSWIVGRVLVLRVHSLQWQEHMVEEHSQEKIHLK